MNRTTESITVLREMFCIYDSKAGAFLPPFPAANREVAKRMIIASAMDPSNDIHKFGSDYTLFLIGAWEETTGIFLPGQAHENLGTAESILGNYQRSQTNTLKEVI